MARAGVATAVGVVLSVCVAANAVSAQHGRYADPSPETTCEYARQLQDPLARKLFLEEMDRESGQRPESYSNAAADTGEESLALFLRIADEPPRVSRGGVRIDSFSARCLSCHDDMGASLGEISIRDEPGGRKQTIRKQEVNHPIGMTYDQYASFQRGFKKSAVFNRDLKFVDGKVGCLTCHNPTNPAKNHLVMSDRQSSLCLSCHDK